MFQFILLYFHFVVALGRFPRDTRSHLFSHLLRRWDCTTNFSKSRFISMYMAGICRKTECQSELQREKAFHIQLWKSFRLVVVVNEMFVILLVEFFFCSFLLFCSIFSLSASLWAWNVGAAMPNKSINSYEYICSAYDVERKVGSRIHFQLDRIYLSSFEFRCEHVTQNVAVFFWLFICFFLSLFVTRKHRTFCTHFLFIFHVFGEFSKCWKNAVLSAGAPAEREAHSFWYPFIFI